MLSASCTVSLLAPFCTSRPTTNETHFTLNLVSVISSRGSSCVNATAHEGSAEVELMIPLDNAAVTRVVDGWRVS